MRWQKFLAVLLIAGAAAGCRTCDNPYDDCGPVVDSGFHPMGLRSGGGMAGPRVGPEEIPAPPLAPTPPPAPPDIKSNGDAPPELEETKTTSVMRSRFDYAH